MQCGAKALGIETSAFLWKMPLVVSNLEAEASTRSERLAPR